LAVLIPYPVTIYKIGNSQKNTKAWHRALIVHLFFPTFIRYLYSGFNTFFKRPKGRGIKPLNTNKARG
jgi:hypothetical protein